MTTATIPNRPVFRATEVCEIAQVQPYVLRSWEAEFPDLRVAKTPGSPRLYRRGDVERVLQIKHLLFVDGLTLAGARRQLGETSRSSRSPEPDDTVPDAEIAALADDEMRGHLRDVRRGLQWILGVLSGDENVEAAAAPFTLSVRPAPASSKRTAVKKAAAKTVAKGKVKGRKRS